MSSNDEPKDVQLDISKYEGHQPAPWRWVKPMGMKEWFLYAEQGNHSNLNHQKAGGIWLPDTFCRLGMGLDPTHRDEKSTYDLITDAPLLLEKVKTLQRKLMLAESALGEIRAYHESGQGNLGEIIEHYQKNEQVEMPNAFDEDDA
ncbi:MAG: hypothetical protein CME55_06660 [Halieaceae bacterium]|nr:hypothetical protein [Halieaceae bacterium]